MKSALITLILISTAAQAADKEVFVYLGHGLSGHTNAEILGLKGRQTGSPGLNLGVDRPFPVTGIFSISFIYDAQFFGNPGGRADFHQSFMGMPRVHHDVGAVRIWAGIGIGPMFTLLGKPEDPAPGLKLTYDNSTQFSFAISPRIGADMPIGDGYFIGVQGTYTTTSSKTPLTVTNEATFQSTSFSADATRNWWSGAIRFGMSFGGEE